MARAAEGAVTLIAVNPQATPNALRLKLPATARGLTPLLGTPAVTPAGDSLALDLAGYEVKVLRDAKTLAEKAELLVDKYEMKATVKVTGETVAFDLGSNKYDEKRARDSAAVALVAREVGDPSPPLRRRRRAQ